MKRIFTNICTNNLEMSKKFYVELLSFKVNYQSDWFVHLVSVENEALELGLIQSRLCIATEQFWSVRKIKVLKPL